MFSKLLAFGLDVDFIVRNIWHEFQRSHVLKIHDQRLNIFLTTKSTFALLSKIIPVFPFSKLELNIYQSDYDKYPLFGVKRKRSCGKEGKQRSVKLENFLFSLFTV